MVEEEEILSRRRKRENKDTSKQEEHLNNLQLHTLISLNTNETRAHGINDHINQLLLWVAGIQQLSLQVSISHQLLQECKR